MKNFMDKFYQIVDKIGKQNFILVVFIFIVIVVTGLYQTFSLFTSTDGSSLIDGIMTYKFILNSDNTENSITVASGSSKNVMMTVSNPEDLKLKYGVYYSSSDDLSSVSLGYLSTSEHKGMDLIDAKSDYIISIKVSNNSSSDVTITFGVAYGVENGGDLLLDTGKHWLGKGPSPLAEMSVGSFVKYTGNNGCSGDSCSGKYDAKCYDRSNDNVDEEGWRIAYINNNTSYLIYSGGTAECLATDENGNASSSKTSTALPASNLTPHFTNLNNAALKYCNKDYAYGGTCGSASAWAITLDDFEAITGAKYTECLASGYDDLSDDELEAVYLKCNGYLSEDDDLPMIPLGTYWFASELYLWDGSSGGIALSHESRTSLALGVIPIVRLDESVKVTGGSGTMDDPYVISNG